MDFWGGGSIYIYIYCNIFPVNINVYNNRQKSGHTGSDLGCHLCAGLTLPLAGWLKGLVGSNAKDTFQLICLCFIKRGWYDLKQQGFPYSFQILLIFESGKDQLRSMSSMSRYLFQAEDGQISWLLHLGSFQQLAHISQLLGTYCEISWNDLCQVSRDSNLLWICSSQLDVIQVVSLLAVRRWGNNHNCI